MNDAMRGVVIAVAVVAFYYAARLASVYLVEWIRKQNRRHIAQHVFWLVAGLTVNAGLAVATEIDRTGVNSSVQWREWMLLWAHAFIAIGLRPLWREHLRRVDRRTEEPA